MLDLATFTQQIYQRLRSHAAGADVRAALPAGAAAILRAAALRNDALPARPLLAGRRLAPVAMVGGLTILKYRWHLYDDPARDYLRIEQLYRLIADAYTAAPLGMPGHAIGTLEIIPGPQDEDRAIGLLYSFIDLAYYAGGPA